MITILSAFVSLLSFRLRSRADLELELVALRHQVAVLRRQHKGRLQLFSTDRLLWVWLYRVWPQALNTMVLVKPAKRPGEGSRVSEKSRLERVMRDEQKRIAYAVAHLRLAKFVSCFSFK